ncbi:hypothetical protein F5148DRAFT_1286755 [Russula earlei]|uniref:Uncharacterized protein n=1 Tax=Russula earlei TaxID=71964 RepID=A0ACC0U3B6_9AGAM|nr:hypothetical protein F5148DRAFT_1286755 [Russula earlei]
MSSYSRWVRDEEDIDRLPHGMVRTAYDADHRQYTFRDTQSGVNYVGAPGDAYGTLVPAATANFPKHCRSAGRRRTFQAYDRPVLFAEDVGGQRRNSPHPNPHPPSPPPKGAPTTTWAPHQSGATRSKRGHGRTASFSDILPPHLIARASNSAPLPPPPSSAPIGRRSPTEKGERRGDPPKWTPLPSSSPSPIAPSSSSFEDEKKLPRWGSKASSSSSWSPTGTTGELLSGLPLLPPPPPSKDPRPPDQLSSGGVLSPRVALRFTARMIGRTLEAVKGRGNRRYEGGPNVGGRVVT